MKIYRMNDCEWWLANSLDDAIADMKAAYGASDEEIKEYLNDPRELTDEELDSLKYCDEGGMYGQEGEIERWRCPLCNGQPRITREWRWDGEKWEHDHSERSGRNTLWIPSENTMARTFREELQRTKDDGVARMFATSEI